MLKEKNSFCVQNFFIKTFPDFPGSSFSIFLDYSLVRPQVDNQALLFLSS